MRFSKKQSFFLTVTLIVCFVCIVVAYVQYVYHARIFHVENSPSRPVAMVFGASLKNGQPNTVLEDRLRTAKELYDEKKVQKLILSGDNRAVDYNEPQAMKRFLLAQGMNPADIVLDYAGQRTYDSCYRLRAIFGQSSVILVSQSFHLPRALYLCNNLGVDAIGVSADQIYPTQWWSDSLREFFASFKAWIDIAVYRPVPILGKPEKVF